MKNKSRQHGQKGRILAETHHEIYNLYWNDNFEQHGLSRMFKIDQGHISRMVNSKRAPYQVKLFIKKLNCEKAIKPNKSEDAKSKNKIAKLTWKKVSKIREQYFTGLITQVKLAKEYKVNQSTISQIVCGQKWKK